MYFCLYVYSYVFCDYSFFFLSRMEIHKVM